MGTARLTRRNKNLQSIRLTIKKNKEKQQQQQSWKGGELCFQSFVKVENG